MIYTDNMAGKVKNCHILVPKMVQVHPEFLALGHFPLVAYVTQMS